MSQTRQLAAIMFTDIVGYTSLMGQNEQKAFELLKKNRQLQRPIIEHFNGRWLKEIGDGVLASFNSVIDAVHCAATIQKNCEEHPELKLRIGIHLGEVVFEGNDVFGDGVNIASRLEPLAPIGGILVSESVQNNLLNKSNVEIAYLGEEELKNVSKPVKVYQVKVEDTRPFKFDAELSVNIPGSTNRSNQQRIIWGAVTVVIALLLSYLLYSAFEDRKQTETVSQNLDKSIVVLPFADMSVNQDQEYFSDGMMEEILNHLVKIEDIKVVSRTTAMKYKGTDKTTKEIAAELGVATVLEGSVRKDGDQVRITVQLIEGSTNMHLFSESYDRQLTSIFGVQSEVAELVAKVLQAQISPEVRLRIEGIPTHNTMAYELYLRGRRQYRLFWQNFDINLINIGIDYYNQAIALDPEFSSAYVGLGQAYWMLTHFSPDYDPNQWELSKANLYKAIELDPNNGWAYAELGVVQHNWDWDQQAALESFQKAVALSPADPEVHNHLRIFYAKIGECDKVESETRIRNVLQNQDYDPQQDLDLLVCRRDLEQIAELDADNFGFNKFDLLMFQGRYQELIKSVSDSNLAAGNIFPIPMVGEAYALSGDTLSAYKVLDSLKQLSMVRHVQISYFVPVHLALGNHETAFQLLEQALEQRELQLHILTRYFVSVFNIQDDPRFIDIIERSWIPQE
ncbi:MAG: hypothetical protein DHS20C17_01110 [Cyclobacteriaceae bacterium]|nr:MAG: hypothetical protein DHS20C17_01110 [Cyclobacteriaceae bacterium]